RPRRARRSRPCSCPGSRCGGTARWPPRGWPRACGRNGGRRAGWGRCSYASWGQGTGQSSSSRSTVPSSSDSQPREHVMSKLVVTNFLTLDGVMQSPGHPDEDRRGGFEHGGWAAPYGDPVMGEAMGVGMAEGGTMLFGRRTYEKMEAAWADGPEDSPFTA